MKSGEAHDKVVQLQQPVPGQVLRKGTEVLHQGEVEGDVHGVREPSNTILVDFDGVEKEIVIPQVALGQDQTMGLIPGFIFVFGSNDRGVHGAGAAYTARVFRNFPEGIGEGLSHQCYALPTKDINIRTHTLAVVRRNVMSFLHLASVMYDLECAFTADPRVPKEGHTRFQVTRVGCGLADLDDVTVAMMFETATPNCWFDTKWRDILGEDYNYWGTF